MKLNNKGQALVAFIILLPIILFILSMVIDLGLMGLEKRKINNTVRDSIEYGLKHNSSKEQIRGMIDKNIKYENITIDMNDDINISLYYRYNTIFGFIKKKDLRIKYHGYKENNKIKIEEEYNG